MPRITADELAVAAEAAKLSEIQTEIVQLRRKGLGYRKMSTATGLRPPSCRSSLIAGIQKIVAWVESHDGDTAPYLHLLKEQKPDEPKWHNKKGTITFTKLMVVANVSPISMQAMMMSAEGMMPGEIAAHLGLGVNTVQSRLDTGFAQLRRFVGKHDIQREQIIPCPAESLGIENHGLKVYLREPEVEERIYIDKNTYVDETGVVHVED